MDDTIKRSDAIKWFEPYANRGLKIPVETVIQNLKDIPSADKQGEWISLHNGKWKCSECGIEVLFYAKGNFCPNCGAKMKGADDD